MVLNKLKCCYPIFLKFAHREFNPTDNPSTQCDLENYNPLRMKMLEFKSLRVLMCLLFVTVATASVSGQTLTNRPNVYINSNCNGYVEFLPSDYNTTTGKYPLLIFLHGNSQWGPGTNASLQSVRDLGPNLWANYAITQPWVANPGFVDLNKMVMISPQ